MKSKIKRVFAMLSVLSIVLVSVVLAAPAGLAEGLAGAAPNQSKTQGDEPINYAVYRSKHGGSAVSEAEIALDLSKGAAAESLKPETTHENGKPLLRLAGDSGAVQFEIEAQTEGSYALYIEYTPYDTFGDINFSMQIDGRTPFQEALSIRLERPYLQEGDDFTPDEYGNDLSMKKKVAQERQSKYLSDTSGNYVQPFQFFLTAGTHTVTLDFQKANFEISDMTFRGLAEAAPYQAPDSAQNSSKQLINIQAELPHRVSSSTLTAFCDKSDAATYPNDPAQSRLNIIGGSSWTQQGQWISWKFNITEPGVYYIGMRARQNLRSGLFSTRKITIDGKLPFQELEDVKFENRLGWYNKSLGGDTPYGFHFDKGEHEIRMEVTPGVYADTMQALSEATAELNDFYRRIIMITGSNPDEYQDYALEENIPDMIEGFAGIRDTLLKEKERLERESGLKGSEMSTLTTVATQLDSFVKQPGSIAGRLNAFRESISTLSAWYLQLGSQPLEIDQIYIYSPDVTLPRASAGFFSNLAFGFRAIVASFMNDYDTIDLQAENKANELNIWINTGRDQLKVLNQILVDGFQKKYNTKVNVNVSAATGTELPVQKGLLEMLMTGRGPDICLYAPSSNPVELALRNALIPLNQFEGFEEITERFNEQAMVPYRFQGNSYALPITQVFNVMFYRTDILAELGLEVPETWDDLYRMIPIIQSKNLEVGIPSDVSTFQTMLFQQGIGVFKDDLKQTSFDAPEALKAFEQWTDLYATYSFDMTFNFFNRFRTGEVPIGLSTFTTYTQLMVSAPEITGLWDVALVPGMAREDGTIDHSVVGSGSMAAGGVTGGGCAFITKDTKNKELAWEFLKWFTSADVQYEFGIQQEMLLGPTGRYTPANLEAFERLPWDDKAKEVLLKQRNFIKETPQVPGGYYVSRDVNNALRQVVLNDQNPRQILNYYNMSINGELRRKRIELGLDKE